MMYSDDISSYFIVEGYVVVGRSTITTASRKRSRTNFAASSPPRGVLQLHGLAKGKGPCRSTGRIEQAPWGVGVVEKTKGFLPSAHLRIFGHLISC